MHLSPFTYTYWTDPSISFAMMSIIGFFLFFTLWESRSRYLVSLTPLIIMLSCMRYLGRRDFVPCPRSGSTDGRT